MLKLCSCGSLVLAVIVIAGCGAATKPKGKVSGEVSLAPTVSSAAIRSSRFLQELVAGIVNETVDPREVFSLRGILRSFVS